MVSEVPGCTGPGKNREKQSPVGDGPKDPDRKVNGTVGRVLDDTRKNEVSET